MERGTTLRITVALGALALMPAVSMADYVTEVTADSPVAYWRLGESSGTTADDQTTNNIDGAYANTPTLGVTGLIPGDADTAVLFNGTNERVDIPNNTLINSDGAGYTNKTIELWFNADTVAAGADHDVIYEQGGATNGLNVYLYQGQVHSGAWEGGGTGTGAWASAPVNAGQTYLSTMTYNGATGTVKQYVNGQLIDTATGVAANIPAHTGDINIGSRNDVRYADSGPATADTDYFDGTIDDVSLYNTTLSSSRIRTHADAALSLASTAYYNAVTADDPIVYYRGGLENFATTGSGIGAAGDFDLVSGSPGLTAASLMPADTASFATRFNGGTDGLRIPDSASINTGVVAQRTVELWFNADDINTRQVLFEEGGGGNGVNAYVENGRVRVGTWNTTTNAQNHFLDAEIEVGATYHLTLSIDSSVDDVMTAFLNGTAIGAIKGVEAINGHVGDIGVGRMFNDTRVDDGTSDGLNLTGDGLSFDGTIDDVSLYAAPQLAHTTRGRIAAAGGTNNAYEEEVFGDDPLAVWQLGESSGSVAVNVATNGSGLGNQINGDIAGSATQNANRLIVGGDNDAYRFNGQDTGNDPSRVLIPDNTDYNRNVTRSEKTIEANFYLEGTGSGTETRRVIYEEGAGSRGLNIFVSDLGGSYELIVGAWNDVDDDGAGSAWGVGGGGELTTFLRTAISLQTPYQVQLVLDGSVAGSTPTGTLRGYINGQLFGEVSGVGNFHPHDAAQIGAQNGDTRYETALNDQADNTVNGHGFLGIIDDVSAYGSAFDLTTANAHFAAAQPYMNEVLGDDPVAYWRLGENGAGGNTIAANVAVARNGTGAGVGSLADGTFGSAVDLLGFENGLIANDPNGAASFNGTSNSVISFPDVDGINVSIAPLAERTIELVFRAIDTSGRQVLFEEGGAGNGFNIYIEDGELIVGAWTDNAAAGVGNNLYSSIAIDAFRNYHVALVFDSDSSYFAGFLNGVEFDPITSGFFEAMNNHSDDIAIGGMLVNSRFTDGVGGTVAGSGAGFYFTGIIDEVAVYNTALSSADIKAHYAATGIPTPAALTAGLALLVPMMTRRKRR